MNDSSNKIQGTDSSTILGHHTNNSLSNAPAWTAYPQVRGIRFEDFQLPPTGLTEMQRAKALTQLQQYLAEQQANFLGYQVNQQLLD